MDLLFHIQKMRVLLPYFRYMFLLLLPVLSLYQSFATRVVFLKAFFHNPVYLLPDQTNVCKCSQIPSLLTSLHMDDTASRHLQMLLPVFRVFFLVSDYRDMSPTHLQCISRKSHSVLRVYILMSKHSL